jgi:O-antigen ligase
MNASIDLSTSRGETKRKANGLWTAVMCLWLFYIIVFGGVSIPNMTNFMLQSISSLGVIIVCLWNLKRGLPTALSMLGALLLLFCFVIVLAQLIPLPPNIWTSFPGREFQMRMYSILAVDMPWQPISLTPGATKEAALALLPAAAGFLLAVSSSTSERTWIAATIIGCAVIGLFVGLMQQIQGPESPFFFYGNFSGVVSGTFGNRNFYASQLYTTIPFVAALSVAAQEKYRLPNWLVAIFSLVYIGVLIIGLAGTASRAGTLLSMLAIILAAAFVYRPQNWGRNGGTKRSVTVAVLGAVLLFSQVGMAAILRLSQTDLEDLRSQIYEVSWSAAKEFFPVGSGFGSFVPIYKMFETPRIVIEQFVNHAHNDWLELLLEGGIAAAVLFALFLALYLTSTVQLLRQEFQSSNRAILRAGSVVIFLLLLHGFVDFGLRTPALITLFSLCCGFVTLGRQNAGVKRSNQRSGPNDRIPPPPLSKRRTTGSFGGATLAKGSPRMSAPPTVEKTSKN